MRIGELSRTSGVPVPTIKFYLREGLLPAGELTSPNQARYGEEHLRRLHLIRALTDVGGLPLAAVGKVVEAVEDRERPVHELLGTASKALTLAPAQEDDGDFGEQARVLVRELIERHGWRVQAEHPAARILVSAVASVLAVGHDDYLAALDTFAVAAERIAAEDLAYVALRNRPEDLAERVVVGTVLGDVMLTALRRLAQSDASARRYAADGDGPAGTASEESSG